MGDIPPTENKNSLASRILARAAAQPHAVAVDDGETAVTFDQLIAQASALAESLAGLAEPIGILLPPSTQYIVAIVAMLLAGKTYVPMDSSFPQTRNLRIVSHSGMTGVVVNAATAGIAQALDPSVRPITIPPPAPGQAPYEPAAVAADRIVAIFYTSGSTGEPKGVCHGESGLAFDVEYYIAFTGLGPGDCHSLLISPAMSSSNRDIFGPLLTGAGLAIADLKRLGLSAGLRCLHRRNVTFFHAVPSVFRALFGGAEANAGAAGKIRVLRVSGDRVLPRDVEIYRKVFPRTCRFTTGVGTTETRPYTGWFIDHDTPLERPLVPVGFALPGQHLMLVAESGAAVAPGEVGEVVVASPGLSPGYWRNEALTKARFAPSASHPGMTEYRTGDFGRWLPDGMLEFIGRRDRQIKVSGNTVNLGEIEAVIGALPTIAETAVIARTTGAETAPIAYCVYAAGPDPTEEVRAWCAAHLPPAFRPAEIVPVEVLPKLASEKVDLVALERLDGERVRSATAAAAAARAGLKADIVGQAWSELFGADTYLRDLPFEAAGGNSLQGMRLLLAIERRLDRHLPNTLLDAATRPSELAARLTALGDAAMVGGTAAGRPTLILFPGLFGADFTMTRFARRLGEHFNVVLMDYRHAGADLLGPADSEHTFAEFESAFEAAGRPARLWVMGNSFGCRIAVEAARRFVARGIPVEFVAVIDGPTEDAIATRNSRRAATGGLRLPFDDRLALIGGRRAFVVNHIARFIANRLVTYGMHARIHTLSAFLSRVGLEDASLDARRVAIARARSRAFKDVLSGPLPMPLTLFVSTAPYSLSQYIPDLGWTKWCSALRIIALPGNHIEIVSEPASTRIVDALVDADRALSDRAA
ncbi:MAG: alpha/beta fold hydrolase [Rhizomicrobium sp.]